MLIRKLAHPSLWCHVYPTEANLWLIAVGNAMVAMAALPVALARAELALLGMAPLFPQGLLSVSQQAERKNIHHSRTAPPQFHMFTTFFPASPFEDSTGIICKCFLSILEEAVDSRILESTSANSARISTSCWLRPLVVSSTSRRVEITFPQNYGPCYKFQCVDKELTTPVHWSDCKMNMRSWESHPKSALENYQKVTQKCHLARWIGKGVGWMQKECIHASSAL